MKELHGRKTWKGLYRGAALGAACLFFWLAGITGLAVQTGTVRIDNVNVRKEAGAESDRVCQLPANTPVTILDEAQGGDGKTWYSVSFTYEGAETTGWIREDMLDVSESEEPDSEGGEPQDVSIGGFTILEPEEEPAASDALVRTELLIGEEYRTVWQVSTDLTGGWELYLVYAAREDGSTNWFFYDSDEGTFQRNLGQFSGTAGEPEGLIEALESELTELKETNEKKLSQRLYIIIGLGVLCAILLILVIIFAVKYRNSEYEYYDDEDEDDEDGFPERRRRFFRRKDEEEDEEVEEPGNGFDEFVAAVRKKWSEDEEDEDEYEEDEYSEEDEEYLDDDDEYEEYDEDEPDGGDSEDDIELPEIDMSAVLEIEEEARKQAQQEEAQEEDDEFDIEILDFEDLDL